MYAKLVAQLDDLCIDHYWLFVWIIRETGYSNVLGVCRTLDTGHSEGKEFEMDNMGVNCRLGQVENPGGIDRSSF